MYHEAKLSIIIPTYNDCINLQELLKNLKSVLFNNSQQQVDILIIDGASTDKTVKVVEEYKDIVSKFVSEPDKGIYDAMNKGIALVKSDFVYFLGADDKLTDDFSKVLAMLKNPLSIYYGNVLNLHTNKWYKGMFNRKRLVQENICHQGIIYPIQVFNNYKYDTSFSIMADYKLNIQLFADDRFSFSYIDVHLANYGGNGKSNTSIEKKFAILSYWIVFQNFGVKYVFYKVYYWLLRFFK